MKRVESMDVSSSKGPPLAYELRARAHAAIPGGCHTHAKGHDQFPEAVPPLFVGGYGCRAYDPEGREFIEYNMGLRAVVLGHGYPPVLEAAQRAMAHGTNFTRPHVLELECAERFLEMIPGAEMVKFTKDGSTATSAAVRLARAYTGRQLVAACTDHPFFSYDDWFMGTTPVNAGIPESTTEMTVGFPYNDIEGVRAVFDRYPGQIAAVILEPVRDVPPANGFLHELQEECRRQGAVLILDEMITGFRYHPHGAQAMFDLQPDLATFGKGLGNGFAISALSGRRELMELGGLDHQQDRIFLLSTTHGAETHALAAAKAVMDVFDKEPVVEHLDAMGRRLQVGAQDAARRRGLEDHFSLVGYPCNLGFICRDSDGNPSQGYRSLFLQELARNGIVAPSFVVSYSHSANDIDYTIDAVDRALAVYAQALNAGYEKFLVGEPSKPVMRRRN